jgi:ribA/ribD-fused uncharacterized protein
MRNRDYIVHDERSIRGFFGDYGWLSNFYPCEVLFEGITFPSVENAYVFAKMPVDLREHRPSIVGQLLTLDAAAAKRLGREQVPIRKDWESVKYDVMCAVVFDKFYRHRHLRDSLIATGTRYLEETNNWQDRYWGVCDGIGQNKLGKILMRARDFWSGEYQPERKAVSLF